MMRAVINSIELRVLQVAFELIVNVDDQLLGEIPARYTRLIGDDDRQPAIIVQDPNRLRRIRKQTKARRVIDVPNLLGECSITIDEDCGSLHLHHATESHKLLTVFAKLPRFSNACECSNTSSTVIAVIQR